MLKKDPVLKEKIVAFINSFYREERRSPSFQEIGSYFNINKTTAYRYILEMKNEGMVGYDGKSITTSVTSLCNSPARNNAPICGEIGCGDPTSELENIEEYVNLPESIFGTGELYILRAYGDSMVDSGIEPGVLVVIDKNARPKVDDIVVVLNADNENTLKQYKGKKNGKYVFAYMNEEKYPGETIELDSFVCQGVAKHMIKSF
jgi:repressor LexA